MTLAIVEYEPITAALASVEKYRGLVCDVTTPKGMAEAKAAQREVGALRIALDKTRKKVKEDVLARGKLIDGEANRIFGLIAAIEDPIKVQIEAEERKEEEKRQAAILAEQQRLEAAERARKEEEERKLADARAKLERERAEFEQKQAEARRRQDEEERAHRERMRAEENAARERLRAEEEKLEAERQRLAAEQRAKDEVERKAREKREAAEREERRKVTELLDAEEMVHTFVARFGHLKRFAPVVIAIKALPPKQQRRAA